MLEHEIYDTFKDNHHKLFFRMEEVQKKAVGLVKEIQHRDEVELARKSDTSKDALKSMVDEQRNSSKIDQ